MMKDKPSGRFSLLIPEVARIRRLLREGNEKGARRLLPPERAYPVDRQIGKRILIS
jgi:hypothetical protein